MPSFSGQPEMSQPDGADRVISLKEVAMHDHPGDCWIVLYDTVYDITPFLSLHPGGADILLEAAGRDATLSYEDVGHSKANLGLLATCKVGVLPPSELLPLPLLSSLSSLS